MSTMPSSRTVLEMRDYLSPLLRFTTTSTHAVSGRSDPQACDFSFGNPHDMPLPAVETALARGVKARDKDWFAYKMSEPESVSAVLPTLKARLGIDFDSRDIFMTNGASQPQAQELPGELRQQQPCEHERQQRDASSYETCESHRRDQSYRTRCRCQPVLRATTTVMLGDRRDHQQVCEADRGTAPRARDQEHRVVIRHGPISRGGRQHLDRVERRQDRHQCRQGPEPSRNQASQQHAPTHGQCGHQQVGQGVQARFRYDARRNGNDTRTKTRGQ
jgi:hypothetical protein